jgi:hypothetical protein
VCTLCEPLWCAPPPPISEATSAAVLAPMLASAVCFWKFLTGTPLYRLPWVGSGFGSGLGLGLGFGVRVRGWVRVSVRVRVRVRVRARAWAWG